MCWDCDEDEGTYLLPIFTMGKFFKHDEKILLPLSGQFHHAVCDGYHAGMLYNELQLRADACTEWLPNYTTFLTEKILKQRIAGCRAVRRSFFFAEVAGTNASRQQYIRFIFR